MSDAPVIDARVLSGIDWKASRYATENVSREDLYSEGCLAAVTAMRTFDPNRGVTFYTYAVRSAEFAMRTHRRSAWMIALPPETAKLAREAIAAGTPREALSACVVDALDTWRPPLSLDAPFPGGMSEDPAGETVPGIYDRADEALIEEEERRAVQALLECLTPKERAVIVRLFGLDGKPEVNMQSVASQTGLSRQRIHQIRTAAIAKIQRHEEYRIARSA